jgi:hypothetical protein
MELTNNKCELTTGKLTCFTMCEIIIKKNDTSLTNQSIFNVSREGDVWQP